MAVFKFFCKPRDRYEDNSDSSHRPFYPLSIGPWDLARFENHIRCMAKFYNVESKHKAKDFVLSFEQHFNTMILQENNIDGKAMLRVEKYIEA